MGCRTNDKKASIKDDYFIEEKAGNHVIKGIESKDRTYTSITIVRSIIWKPPKGHNFWCHKKP